MCGLAGIFGGVRTADERKELVHRMAEVLAHRGPDDATSTSAPNFALAHRRLSIIDLEHGRQPMESEDGRYLLAFNGEIYNYLELREKLQQRGARFRTASDTEVFLQLLIHDGEQALRQANGMFAFAFVDRRDGTWMLARDPLGIKPLYYCASGGEVAFASEIKALLIPSLVSREADAEGLHEYLTLQFCLGPRTLFRGVNKIEPGTFASGRDGTVLRVTRYWDTTYEIDERRTEADFVEELQSLIADSTRLQLRSDVPLGVYLSGGLDSSIVTAYAADHAARPLHCFHGAFAEGAAYDESSYARLVADSVDAELHVVTPTAADFVADLPKLIRAMDEPLAGPGLFPQYRVSRLAREKVKVVLGGQGGDEIFGGYARYLIGYLEQALKGAIFETQEEGKHLVTLGSIVPNLPVLRQYQPLMQRFWQTGLFEPMDARYFRLIDRSPDLENILAPEARRRFDSAAVFEKFQAVFNHPHTASYFNKMTHFDLKTLLPALLHVEDRVSMAVSLESRVPFVDTRIVDLVARMPPAMKFRGGHARYVLRKAVEKRVPAAILQRKDKMGFPVPLSEWLGGSPVREFAEDILLGPRCRNRGLFDSKGLETLMRREGAYGRQVWGALCLELWHREFVDASLHEPIRH
jgi:asparagine synthase (glutamine-hydrolysing)